MDPYALECVEGQQQVLIQGGIGRNSAVFLGILSGLAFGSAVFAMIQLQQTEREARMLEYYVLEMDAKLIAAGVKKPEDAVSKKLKE